MAINPIQIQKFLKGRLPRGQGHAGRHARRNGADDNVIQSLTNLRRSRFNSPNDVWEAIGESK